MQHRFGISADEALYHRPAWEIDNLMGRHIRDVRAARDRGD